MTITPGEMIGDRYRVYERLGRGGMADVWCAVEVASGREVAIKVLLPRASKDAVLVERMQREALAATAIKSPHICPLLGSGSIRGRPYLVFERLRGEPLEALLVRESCLPFGEVAALTDEVLQGLVAAHEAGVIHRDLTPSNVFLEEAGGRKRAKILDFGISKVRETRSARKEQTLTKAGSELGSVAYMAPEQAEAASDVDERADIYAVGTIAFRSLAGRLPFQASNPRALLAMKADRDPPTLGEITGERWPAAVERFLQKALARRIEDRYASARSALTAWRGVVAKTERARGCGMARDGEGSSASARESRSEVTRTDTMIMIAARIGRQRQLPPPPKRRR